MIRAHLYALALASTLCADVVFAADAKPDLRTTAEKSDFIRTGRYAEVVRLCADFQKAYPQQVRCFKFGRSPEGRDLLALAVSADGMLDAKAARTKSRAVFLMQGGIHAGEIDGKDAGFLAVHDLLDGRIARDALKNVTVVFVPIFNVDGHERFGPNNRPNQIGPKEMGWRATAQNLNLNRDYVKADAPEMQAMLRLLNEWDPIVYADLHVTDGAEFEHDISIGVSPTYAGDAELVRAGTTLRDAIMRDLKAKGSLPVDFYPSFVKDDDPSSGFAVGISPPRFSNEYWARRNRIGVLVETHSWKNYQTRVSRTYTTIVSMVEQTAAHGTEWRATIDGVENRARVLAGKNVDLAYENTTHTETIEFRGYRYTREPSPISGSSVTKYDNTRPEIWRVPLYDELKPSLTIAAPRGGYIVPVAWANMVAAKLSLHAVEFKRISTALPATALKTFRVNSASLAHATNEGRATETFDGKWQDESREVPSGSLFVPIAQANSQMAMTLLEPQSADSLAAWGFFASAFERKEYMEAYVAEQFAADLLKKDPALKEEFERKLREDADFAKNPRARLEFFHRRHPSFDDRFNLYPVYRIDTAPIVSR